MGMEHFEPDRIKDAKKLPGFRDFLKDETSGGNVDASETMTRVLRMTLAGVALYTAVPAPALAAEKSSRHRVEHQSESEERGFSKEEFELVAKNIFFEASLEGPPGQLAVAQVTFARVAANRKEWGQTVHSVVYAKYQFSWTAHERDLNLLEAKAVKDLGNVLARHFKGKSAEEIVAELSAVTGLPAETLYYKRSDWNENDPNETHMTEGTRRMFRSLVWLKNIGNHAFYIDPPKSAMLEKRRVRN
jgi:hypothetical protein